MIFLIINLCINNIYIFTCVCGKCINITYRLWYTYGCQTKKVTLHADEVTGSVVGCGGSSESRYAQARWFGNWGQPKTGGRNNDRCARGRVSLVKGKFGHVNWNNTVVCVSRKTKTRKLLVFRASTVNIRKCSVVYAEVHYCCWGLG